ncbi:hypothetical protein CWE08_10485 [Aliidiomarina iranensis]|uniref:Cyanophycinase n=1 Tax=Aliidiomarina iranensis TaxID=1434071 RepID=A0A432VRN7_9GAMM|nr:cyanophycinase [Aliidiomarina iranensis]RUO18978.1 hypothetical protein CWE08_10485 [Aliidiomarina iranensis]
MFVVKQFKYLLFIYFIFNFGVSLAASEATSEDANLEAFEWNLMLVGGSMNTCSSMAPGRCADTSWIDPEKMRTTNFVDVSDENIQRILAEVNWQGDAEIRAKVAEMLASAKRRFAGRSATMEDFTGFFRDLYTNLWREVTTPQWYLIRDNLQATEQPDQHEISRPELSKEAEGADLFAAFAQRAKYLADAQNQEPLVLVVTASGRDSFDAVDFYLDTFRSQGVQAQWLPIDAAFGHAVAANNCEAISQLREVHQQAFARERVYPWLAEQQKKACENPEMLLSLIAKAQGVFINGGDQSLTRQAFYSPNGNASSWFTAIRARMNEGMMVAGGTSAGTAVMSGAPMISNGSSEAALREGAFAMAQPPAADCARFANCEPAVSANSLTYHPQGGLGLFPFGILDTHFSERGRQGRLLSLQHATGTPLGVGVDETTALLVNAQSGEFRVQGAHGVFIQGFPEETESGVLARFSYLRNGSGGRFSQEKALTEAFFSTEANLDAGASGSHEFLRDRSITAALATCDSEANTAHYYREQQDLSVLIVFDEYTQRAHSEGACEIVNGIIHFAAESD